MVSTTNAINVYATYELNFLQDHNVKAMAGFNQESYHYEERYSKREDLIDQDLPSLSTGSGVQTTKDAFSEYALRSGFFRLNYDYKNRICINSIHVFIPMFSCTCAFLSWVCT